LLARDDVTKSAQNALPRMHQVLLDTISDGVIIAADDGLIVYTNPAEDRLFGYERGALPGKHVSVLSGYPNEENEHLVRGVMNEVREKGIWRGEWRNQRKDGSSFVTSAKIALVEWNGERHFLCIQQDISPNAEAGYAQRESEARLSLALEAAELGVWDWNLLTNTFEYSPRARAICGFALDRPITYEDVVSATHPDDYPRTSGLAQEALDPHVRRRVRYEYRIVRPDAEVRWVVAFGYATFGFHGGEYRALRYVGTIQDITDRRRLEQKERDDAAQLRLAMEAGRFALWSVDQANQSVRSSPELNRLFGFPEDSTPDLADFQSRYAPGVKDQLDRLAQSVVSRGERRLETEYPIVFPDGSRHWLHVRAEIQYDAEGAPLSAIGVVIDITERKRSEEALLESDIRFREAADSAPAPVWMTDPQGMVEFANASMGEFAGLPREKMMGDVWLRLLHPDDLPQVAKIRGEAWADHHASYTFEARFRDGKGKWRWLEVSSKPRIDGLGQFHGYVGLAVDRTEAKQILSALQESEARFRTMSESAPVMIWMSDPNGACLHLNRKLRDFWAVGDSEIGNFDWRSVLHPEDADLVLETVSAAVRHAKQFSVEGRYRDSSGQYRILKTEAQPRLSDNGEFLGMIGVNTDISDIVHAQESQQLVLNELNHRVKNTLAVVQALAHKTFRDDSVTKEARNTFTRRLEALARAHNLLTQTNWERTYLRDVVKAATAICGASSRDRIHVEGKHITLTAKQSLSIAMALHELATNAVKYGSLSVDAGTLNIEWQTTASGLSLIWRERGGPIVVFPERTGFGVRLIEQVLAHELGGASTLKFESDGVVCEMSVPLDSEQV
jgi:PAS domain S-box-containing protein